jgi:hypothetical protein
VASLWVFGARLIDGVRHETPRGNRPVFRDRLYGYPFGLMLSAKIDGIAPRLFRRRLCRFLMGRHDKRPALIIAMPLTRNETAALPANYFFGHWYSPLRYSEEIYYAKRML